MDFESGNGARFERLVAEDGLSQVTVLAILQDRQGFLWFGTQDGLNKYDGYRFTVYRHDPDDPTSLSSNVISFLFEDNDGSLWIGTDMGLNHFEPRREKFYRYLSEENNDHSLRNDTIRYIMQDSHNVLWVRTHGGWLHELADKAGKFSSYRLQENPPARLSTDIRMPVVEDSVGRLWIGTFGDGLLLFDRTTHEIIRYQHQLDDSSSLSSSNVTALLEDSSGNLWVGTEDGGLNKMMIGDEVTFISFQHDTITPHTGLSHNIVRCLLEDSSGNLWIGTNGGLNQYDPQTTNFRQYHHHENDPFSLSHNEILSLAEDAQGNLWVGTRLGINKYDPSTRAFGHHRRRQDSPNSLSSNLVTSFCKDTRSDLWVGTYGGGLNKRIAENPEEYTYFGHAADDPHSLADRHHLPDDDLHHILGDNGVYAIFEDSQGWLWFGTGAGLQKLIPGDHPDAPPTFIRYQYKKNHPACLSHNQVFYINEDNQGNLWIGTMGGGLNKLLPGDDLKFIHYQHDPNEPYSLSDNFVRTIFLDSQGDLWIGTDIGLNLMVPAGDLQFVRYRHEDHDLHSLSDDRIASIAEDARGNLWIGTMGGGLNKFDRQSNRFSAFKEKDGLSNNFVNGVLVDERDQVWVSTNKGINKFDPSTKTFRHYDMHDGVQADEFTQGACFKDSAGQMYFGGINGFNQFHPDDIRENDFLPPVVLTNFLLFNKPVPVSEDGPLKQNINFIKHIELDPEEYIFAFEFSALNYRQPQKNRFAYKLEGFDRDWIFTQANDRKAVYTNVPPGTYSFRVKAANDDGMWNEAGKSVQVTVTQPLWQVLLISSFEGVVIHDKGLILEVNQAALELYGYTKVELIGQSLFKLLPPDLHADVTQRVADGDTTPYESRGLKKDGSTFIIELRAKNVPYQGRDVRVAAIRDITERKKMDDALRKLSRAVEQSGSSILITDLDGTIEFVNPAFSQITGFAWEDAVGQNPRILKSGKIPPEVYEDLWATITKGGVWEGELINKKKNGKYYWEYATISPVKDAGGHTTHFVAVKEDITQRKQAADALQDAHDRLEKRVFERTAELNTTVDLLQQEVEERERAEEETLQRLVVEHSLANISTLLMQTTDFNQTIAATLEETGGLIGASRIFLFRFQAEKATMDVVHEWCIPELKPIFDEVKSYPLKRNSWLSKKLRQEGGFQLEDFSHFPPEVQQNIALFDTDPGEPRCALPVYAGEELIGFLGCHGMDSSNPQHDQNFKTLETIIGMLGNAWQRERMLEILEQRIAARTRELATFFDLATLASRTQSLEEILEPAITRIISTCRCDIICIHQYSEDGKVINLVAQYNLPGNERQSLQEVHLQDNYAYRTKALRDPLVTTNLAQESTLPPALRLSGYSTYLGAQIRTRDHSHGTLSCYRRSDEGFALDEISLLVAMAEQLGVMVENYRLRQLTEEMAVLEERQRLARELHDSITQSLYSQTLFARSGRYAFEDGEDLKLKDSLQQLEVNALFALKEMRLLLFQLQPGDLEDVGLAAAVNQRLDMVERRLGIDVTLQIDEKMTLPERVEEMLYRITIEALNNSLKHASSNQVSVGLHAEGVDLVLEIVDDGGGFDATREQSGMGLKIMRERVSQLGGTLEINSRPGSGTLVRVTLSRDEV